jgi:hypothetical protein
MELVFFCIIQSVHLLFVIRMMSISEYIRGLASVVTRRDMCGSSVLIPTDTSNIRAGEYACICLSCSRLTMRVRTDIGSRMLYTSFPFSISMRVTLTSGIESCSKCTMFCSRTLSDGDTAVRVCSGMVLRMTFAIACPSVSFDVMLYLCVSFKKQ